MVSTAALNDPMLLVLHGLRVKGYVEPVALAANSGLATAIVERELAAALAAGHVVHREGRIAGWNLTPAGREAHTGMAVAALDDPATRNALEAGDVAFVAINEPMKALCTRWQLEGQPATCIDALGELDSQVQPIVATLGLSIPRFARYGTRFAAALERLRGGDLAAFTRPLSDSYHDIWMELHQDLLLTLGRKRAAGDGH